MEKFDANDAWQQQSGDVVWAFGQALISLHKTNPWPHLPLLNLAISHLMTELWDNGFSQSEIRAAFEEALDQMPRYAAGEERRS